MPLLECTHVELGGLDIGTDPVPREILSSRQLQLLEPLFGLTSGLTATTPLASTNESVTSCFILHALNWCEEQCEHIMTFSRAQNLVSLFSMLKGGISRVIEYADNHPDFPLRGLIRCKRGSAGTS